MKLLKKVLVVFLIMVSITYLYALIIIKDTTKLKEVMKWVGIISMSIPLIPVLGRMGDATSFVAEVPEARKNALDKKRGILFLPLGIAGAMLLIVFYIING